MEKVKDSMSTVVSGANLGETIYDPSSHILWSRMAADVAGAGKIKALIALLLTEQGVIQIMGYAKAQNFDDYAPVFEAIARNTRIADNISYKPRITDNIPVAGGVDWSNILYDAIVGAFVGGLVALIAKRVRKKASN